MKSFWLNLFILNALGGSFGCVQPTEWTLVSYQRKVVNGSPDDEHKAVVMILANYSGGEIEFCSGTLISSWGILTAAHCLESNEQTPPEEIKVMFGLGMDDVEATLYITDWWIHPQFDSQGGSLQYDIGLLHLPENPPLGTTPIRPLPHNQGITENDEGLTITYVGFGETVRDQPSTSGKRNSLINSINQVLFDQFMFSSDNTSGGPYGGDGGGPALVFRGNEEFVGGIVVGQTYNWEASLNTIVDAYEQLIQDNLLRDLGEACLGDYDCKLDHCADAFCCDTDCAQECWACDLSSQLGTCATVPDQTPCTGGVCNNGTCFVEGEPYLPEAGQDGGVTDGSQEGGGHDTLSIDRSGRDPNVVIEGEGCSCIHSHTIFPGILWLWLALARLVYFLKRRLSVDYSFQNELYKRFPVARSNT